MIVRPALCLALSVFALGCLDDDPVDRPVASTATGMVVVESDKGFMATFDALDQALDAAPPIGIVARVDHEANAAGAGLTMGPTRLILFGNPTLGTPIMQENQQAGLDLPQKFLVYEDAEGRVVIGYNSVDYLEARHGVESVATLPQIAGALAMFSENASNATVSALGGGSVSAGEGIMAVQSTSDAETTFGRLQTAVEANPNLTVVASLDHQANAASVGLDLRPTRLLIFGNPALGTPLMQSTRSMAIDLPQKMLVYTDGAGDTFILYNDPFFLADRHGETGSFDTLQTIANALVGLAATAAGQ